MCIRSSEESGLCLLIRLPRQQSSWGQHGAHLGLVGPRWAHVGPMNLATRVVTGMHQDAIIITMVDEVHLQLECGTWYHHPWRHQSVLSRNLRMFIFATCHYRCRDHLKNDCIWYSLPCYLLHLQLNNHPIRPPNAASRDIGNWNWNWKWILFV